MKERAKRRINRAYGVIEENVVTSILVTSGAAALLAVALTTALGLYSSAKFEAKTSCTRDPSSDACGKIRQEVARAEPLENPCISHQRVEGTRGRNCPRFFIPRRRHRQVRANPKSIQNLELGTSEASVPVVKGGASDGSTGVGHGKGTTAGPKGGAKAPKPIRHAKPPPAPEDTPLVTAPAETTPAASPQPGNSGETPAASANGVKACVDLAASACVKSEVEPPVHLP